MVALWGRPAPSRTLHPPATFRFLLIVQVSSIERETLRRNSILSNPLVQLATQQVGTSTTTGKLHFAPSLARRFAKIPPRSFTASAAAALSSSSVSGSDRRNVRLTWTAQRPSAIIASGGNLGVRLAQSTASLARSCKALHFPLTPVPSSSILAA